MSNGALAEQTIFTQDRLGALTDPVVAQHASLAGQRQNIMTTFSTDAL